MFKNVVFPAPEGPITAVTSPERTWPVTPFNTTLPLFSPYNSNNVFNAEKHVFKCYLKLVLYIYISRLHLSLKCDYIYIYDLIFYPKMFKILHPSLNLVCCQFQWIICPKRLYFLNTAARRNAGHAEKPLDVELALTSDVCKPRVFRITPSCVVNQKQLNTWAVVLSVIAAFI